MYTMHRHNLYPIVTFQIPTSTMEEIMIGRYIEIISDETKYKGFIKTVDQKEKKIVLEKGNTNFLKLYVNL